MPSDSAWPLCRFLRLLTAIWTIHGVITTAKQTLNNDFSPAVAAANGKVVMRAELMQYKTLLHDLLSAAGRCALNYTDAVNIGCGCATSPCGALSDGRCG